MDGVLIDAKEWHFEAFNRALAFFGYHLTTQEHLVKYDGLPTSVKLEKLTTEKGLPRELHSEINTRKQDYTIEMANQLCKPSAEHHELLATLKEKGYKIGLASNSIRNTVEVMMQKSQLIDYFDVMLSNQDVSKPKPDPEIYVTAFEKLGLSAQECLVIEDNENGINAALSAGAHLLRVEGTHEVNLNNVTQVLAKLELENTAETF